jgi:hypothetical protein
MIASKKRLKRLMRSESAYSTGCNEFKSDRSKTMENEKYLWASPEALPPPQSTAKEQLRAACHGISRQRSRCKPKNHLRMMDDNSETTRTSAICDFDTTDVATSCILVMLSRKEPADGLAASGEGATGGPTQMVQRATYTETAMRCCGNAAPSGVQYFRGCGVIR